MQQHTYLNQSTAINLPTLLETRLLVQANSGGGKSWLLRRLLEQSHSQVQHIVIDSEGEFATLREQYDYLLVGKEGDIPIDPSSAGLLARRLLELNVSAILDLYELHYQDRKRFVRLFLDSMINAPKTLWHPCLVVIDEAHKFCPEKEQSEASSAVIDLATLGRKRGYCAILATQRLSKLHKDAAAECNNKLIGRTNLDVDMKRASEELGFTTKQQQLSLRELQAGEFFAFGPAISSTVQKITIGKVQTTHPQAGSRLLAQRTTPPSEAIKKIVGELHDLPQAAAEEARTIEELHEHITALKRQLSQKNQRAEKSAPSQEITMAVKTALQRQQQTFAIEKQQLQARIEQLTKIIETIAGTIQPALTTTPSVPTENHQPTLKETHEQTEASHSSTTDAAAILAVLQERAPMVFTKADLASLLPSSVRNGAYGLSLRFLEEKGLITITENRVALTQAGSNPSHQLIAEVEKAEQTLELWKRKLPTGARRIFTLLADLYPKTLTKKEIGIKTGYSYKGGGFAKQYRLLRDNGLLEEHGQQVKASDALFLAA
jgi:predicted  nucleic acid-binding Zn-ribbon protein